MAQFTRVVNGHRQIVDICHNTFYRIFYATNSKILRRVVCCEHDWQYADCLPAIGESYVDAPAGNNDWHADWENHVFDATGVVPPDATCAVIDPLGQVVNMLMADPELDAVPGHRLVLTVGRRVRIGDWYNARTRAFKSPDEFRLALAA